MLAGQYVRSHRDYLPQITLSNVGLLEIPAECIGEGNWTRWQTDDLENCTLKDMPSDAQNIPKASKLFYLEGFEV